MGRFVSDIRYASINSSKVKEEFCILPSMSDVTKGSDILHQIQEFTNFKNGQVLD